MSAEKNYTRHERMTIVPRKTVRATGKPLRLEAIAGDDGSAQVNALWYEMGIRRPIRAPRGFRSLIAIAYSRTGGPGIMPIVGVDLWPEKGFALEALLRYQALKDNGFTVLRTVNLGVDEDLTPAS